MSAALAAARAGACVALIDEYAAPGGQIWRRRFDEVGSRRAAFLAPRGARAVRRARRLLRPGAVGRVRVGRARAGRAAADRPGRARARAGAIVLATGAYDRPIAFPGWTLPGVMTAGGAQALAKGQGVVPGRRVLLAGAGPVPAAGRRAAGGERGRGRRRRRGHAPPRLGCASARGCPRIPDRLRRLRRATARRCAGSSGATCSCAPRATGASSPRRSRAAARTGRRPARERTFEVDAVCTAYGFLPSVDLARALGCELRGDAVAHDDDMAHVRPGRVRGRRGDRRRRRRPRAGRGRARGLDGRRPRRGTARATATAASRRSRRTPTCPRVRAQAGEARGLRRHPRRALRPAPRPAHARHAGHDPVPLRGRHRGRGRRRRRRRRDHDVRAEDRHPRRLEAADQRRAGQRTATGRLARRPISPRCAARGRRARASPRSFPTSSTRVRGCSASRPRTRSSAAARTSPRARSTPPWPRGATTMSALKVVTRCGQGPCQGRTCERLVAARLPEPARFSGRAPMRPIPLDVLMTSTAAET